MKRFCFAKFMIVLSIILCMCGLTVSAETARISSSVRMKYAVDEQYVWTVSEDGAVTWHDDNRTAYQVCRIDHVSRIAAAGGTLYCLAEDGQRQTMYVVEPHATEASGYDVPERRDIRQMEASHSMLYLLCDDGKVYLSEPFGLRLFEEIAANDFRNEDIDVISVYDGMLCAYSRKNSLVSVISLESGTLLYPSVTADDLLYVQIGRKENGVYRLIGISDPMKNAGIVEIDPSAGLVQTSDLDLPAECMGLRRNADTVYSLSADGTKLYAASLVGKTAEKNTTVTLLNTFIDLKQPESKEVADVIATFCEKHPDISLVNRSEDDIRVVANGIMSCLPGYDIITIQENFTKLPSVTMYKAGAAVKLEENEQIRQTLALCADVLSPVTAEGHLIGIPVFTNPYLWHADQETAAKIGLTVPEDGWTWDDFFDLGEKLDEYNRATGSHIPLLRDEIGQLPYFLVQYNANAVDLMAGTAAYDSKEFIDALSRWVDLYGKGLIEPFNSDDSGTALLYCFRAKSYSEYTSDEYDLILPPVLNSDTKYPVNIARTVVNANSPCQDVCVDFLAELFTPTYLRSKVFTFNNGFLLADDVARDLQNDPTGNKAVWYAVLADSAQDYYLGDLFVDQWKTLYPALLSGSMSPEAYARTCQQRAEMVLGE